MQNHILELYDIHKYYQHEEVLKGVSLQANKGEVVSIIGSSGAGKSTLLRCINVLEIPNKGDVIIENEKILFEEHKGIRKIKNFKQLNRIRSEIGMVFQSFNLWSHLNILQNIMEAPLKVQKREVGEVREQAIKLLKKVGIEDKQLNYPNQLSGGQQQRAAIARALCINPKIMLFDEPTSALDPELEKEVLKVIKQLAKEGITMVLVTHDMDFSKEISDKVIFLHQGIIEEQGKPSEVYSKTKSARLQNFLNPT